MLKPPIPGPIFQSPLFRSESFKVTNVYTLAPFTWPNPHLYPDHLVSSGFYCLRKADKVQCAFCNLIVSDWRKKDFPFAIHFQRSPFCPYLRGTIRDKQTNKEQDLYELAIASLEPKAIANGPSGLDPYKFGYQFRNIQNLERKLLKIKLKNTCQMCQSAKINSLIFSCCHSYSCVECANILPCCGICDKPIVGKAKINRAMTYRF